MISELIIKLICDNTLAEVFSMKRLDRNAELTIYKPL